MDPGPVASQLLSLSCFVVLLHLLWRSSGGLPGNKAASLLWGCCAWLWTSQTILHKLKGSFRSFWVMCQWKVTGRTWGLEKGQGSWSEQQNRKQHTPRLKCREKQIKAHICRLPCLPAFSCLDLKVIGSQGGDSWRKLRGGESIYLQWDAATLIQDAVSCRMCLPPSSTNTHMLKNTHTHLICLISTLTLLQSLGLFKYRKWVIEGEGNRGGGGWPVAGPGSLYCVGGRVSLSMSSCLTQEVVKHLQVLELCPRGLQRPPRVCLGMTSSVSYEASDKSCVCFWHDK